MKRGQKGVFEGQWKSLKFYFNSVPTSPRYLRSKSAKKTFPLNLSFNHSIVIPFIQEIFEICSHFTLLNFLDISSEPFCILFNDSMKNFVIKLSWQSVKKWNVVGWVTKKENKKHESTATLPFFRNFFCVGSWFIVFLIIFLSLLPSWESVLTKKGIDGVVFLLEPFFESLIPLFEGERAPFYKRGFFFRC